MSRAARIARWIEHAEAARDQVAQAWQRRRQVRAVEDDLMRDLSFGLSTPEQRPAHEVLHGRTITGDQDEERRRFLPDGKRRGGVRLGGSAARAARRLIEGDLGAHGGDAVGRARQLAAGYQPAVLKIVSYARGVTRATATAHYVQREDVILETHDARILADRDEISEEIRAWSGSFSTRAESQDVVAVRLRLQGIGDTLEGRAAYDRAIAAGFEGHRHAFRVEVAPDGTVEAHLVVSMAGASKERLRVRERQPAGEGRAARERRFDSVSDARIRERIVAATGLSGTAVLIKPGITGHGRNGVTWHLNRLVDKAPALDDCGKAISNAAETHLAAREWGPCLRSQSSRDTMHLILSAKAGTDIAALRRAARNFLQDRFADHRFIFGIHADKEEAGHIHAHAIIAVRSESGQKLHPSRETLGEWRRGYAEHAQSEGLKIVATGARERASSLSYGPKDKAIVEVADRPRPGREARDRAYSGDPANRALIANARQRIAIARGNPMSLPRSQMARRELEASVRAWSVVAGEQPDNGFAKGMLDRLSMVHAVSGILDAVAKRVEALTGGETDMAVTAEQMANDLRRMNETVERTVDLLDGPTKQQFRETSARYLETLANRLVLQRAAERGVERMTRAEVEAIVGVNAGRLIERANGIQAKAEREAQSAAKLADRAVEAERRDEAAAGIDPTSQRDLAADRAIVTGSERIAAHEAREARAAAEDAAQALALYPGNRLSPDVGTLDSLAALHAEQERVTREIEADDRLNTQKVQRMGAGTGRQP